MNHRRLLNILVGVALCAQALYSQANQGGISGTITDLSGAIVPGAKVLVVNLNTGIRFEAQSNTTGVYRVPAMEAGSYRIEVEKEGFQRVVVGDVTLQVTQLLSVDVVMTVGSTQTKIEVKAPTEILQTESAALGNTLSTNTIESLPLNSRNFLQLAALTPGVNASIGASSFSRGNKVQVMAGQLSNTAILMDGADINTDFDEGSVLLVNVDAIADYKVVTNAFSAEYGFGNSAINISTKSGTNDFHGSLFEFLRNNVMDARNPFALTKAPLRQNQYGVTFGGPIVHNNTFFFVDWQSLRSRIGTTINAVVPTLAQRNGDFSAQATPLTDPATGQPCTAANRAGCFPGNIIPPTRINSVAKFFLPYIRQPNFGLNQFLSSGSNSFDGNTFDVRVDQNINRWILKNDRIFGRYSYDKRDANNPGNNPGVTDQPLDVLSQNAVLGWTHMFASSMVFDLRGSYYREPIIQNLAGGGENLTEKAGIRGFEQTSQVYPGFPTLTIGGGVMGIDVSGSKPVSVMASHSDLDTSLIWIHGKHSLKMGFHFRNTYGGNTAGSTSRGIFSFTGFYTGNGIGDYMLGIPQNGSRGQPQAIVAGRQHFYHGYFQDNWKITRRLTLDLGLRFEINNPPSYPRNQSSTFDPKTGKIIVGSTSDGKLDLAVQAAAPLAGDLYSDLIVPSSQVGLPSNFMPGTYWMAAPRVGLAWRPIGEKTVFRLGYGIFSVPPELGWFKAAAAQNVPFSLSETVNNTGLTEVQNFFPSGLTLTKATRPFPRISALNPDYHVPYQQQWNVAIQRAFGQNWALELAYAGAEATHLPAPYRINDPGVGAQATIQQRRPYPLYGSISLIGMGGTSSYNSLQVNASRKLSHGLSYTASYSWTKAITLFSAPLATGYLSGVEQIPGRIDLERAVAFYQPPQAFIGSYIYELPFGAGKPVGGQAPKVVSKLISGWQTTGILSLSAGTPFTPSISADVSGTGSPSPRPNYNGGALYPDNKTAAKWFNPAAFSVPQALTFGNAGLNILRGPKLVNLDFGLMKNTAIGERRYLQFRAEAFNFTNTTHLGTPTVNIQSPAAGQILAAQNPRQLQLGLKFIF